MSGKSFRALPEGALDAAQGDCLVVWKSPMAMTLLLVELMLAGGTANTPSDFMPVPRPLLERSLTRAGGGGRESPRNANPA